MLRAVSVPTSVVMWRSAAPIASSACSRKFVAVTFFVLPVALTIAPVSATTLTFVATTLPSVTLVAAFSLALLPVAVTSASPAIVSAPPSASMLIVPPVLTSTSATALTVGVTVVSALRPSSTLPATFSVR